MTQEQDPLHLLPIERWGELQNVFKSDWPRGVCGYATLEIQRRWVEQGIDYEFKVYCPFGDISNGMVAINVKDNFYEAVIQCPKDDTKKLEEAIKKTKLIDWDRDEVVVPFAAQNVIDCLQKAVKDMDVDLVITDYIPLETFILEEANFGDITMPPNITFGPVTLKDLELVDSTWPHRYPNSEWYFKLLMETNSGFGLYLKDKLISWVFFKETGALQHMYTIEEHRKKGYAELLLKLVGKIWLDGGKPVFAFCFKDNVSACKLYRKVGFVLAEPIAWCMFSKKVK